MSEYDGLIADARAKIDACDQLDAWNLMERLAAALGVADAEVTRLRAWLAARDQRIKELTAEVTRLRVRVAELEADHTDSEKGLIDTVHALAGERDSLSKLHEVATERTVQLAAIIETAVGEARASSVPLGMPEGAFYRQVLRRVESTLAAADTDAVLREVRAKAWDEGDRAREAFSRATYDVSVSAREALALLPKNPYRITEGSNDHAGHEFCDPRLGCVLIEGSNDQ